MRHDDPRLVWENVAEWTQCEHGFRPQRVPEVWRLRFEEGPAWRALQCAGVSLRFRTDSRSVALDWWQESIAETDRGEVFRDGKLVGEFVPDTEHSFRLDRFDSSRNGLADWEILFPYHAQMHLRDVCFDAGADVLPVTPNKRKTMLCYGDSITQGWCVSRVSMSWPRLVSTESGWTTINMGFGGAAFCTLAEGEYLASRSDWDALTLAAGINTAGSGRESASSFRKTYAAFLEAVRNTHADKPILCITPMFLADADDVPAWRNEFGCRVSEYRDAIADVVSERCSLGDKHIHILDGLSMIDCADYLADAVHPNDEGMMRMARAISGKWCAILARDVKDHCVTT